MSGNSDYTDFGTSQIGNTMFENDHKSLIFDIQSGAREAEGRPSEASSIFFIEVGLG